ncbi:hypothetical protein J4E81_001245 [Alternaria sp. BMP 2799]|nr:hypothetical protein J4E81_001245 [Alternaria sp. BMP 2799]
MRLVFYCQALWNFSIGLVKISVALLLFRIKQTRPWRIFLSFTIVLLVLTTITSTLFQFLQCRPFSIYWDPSIFLTQKVECLPQEAIVGNIVAASAVHISTDLVFSLIPITFIRKLQRPRGEKIFLGILMGLGLFASSFAILRTVKASMIPPGGDTFFMTVAPTLWSMLELELALIAATIPTLKGIMQRSLVRTGHYFYDEKTETQVRNRLVDLGFLGPNSDEFVEMGRKRSKPDMTDEVVTFGSGSKPRKAKDEYRFSVDELTLVESEGYATTRNLRAFGP